MQPDRNDPEIRAYVFASNAHTYEQMTADIARDFGPARAWPETLCRAVRLEMRSGRGSANRYEYNAEVVAFIAQRAGLQSLNQIIVEGVAEFGATHFPSRSRPDRHSS